MFWACTSWTVIICAISFAAFGLYATLFATTRGFLGITALVTVGMAFYGSLISFIVAAVLFVPIVQIFLAMPYALGEIEVIFLGLTLAILLLYLHMGRGLLPLRHELGAGRLKSSTSIASAAG